MSHLSKLPLLYNLIFNCVLSAFLILSILTFTFANCMTTNETNVHLNFYITESWNYTFPLYLLAMTTQHWLKWSSHFSTVTQSNGMFALIHKSPAANMPLKEKFLRCIALTVYDNSPWESLLWIKTTCPWIRLQKIAFNDCVFSILFWNDFWFISDSS